MQYVICTYFEILFLPIILCFYLLMASSGGRQLPPVTYKNCLQSVQILIWYLKCSLFINTVELGNNELFGQTKICSLMQNVPFAYEVNWHLVTRNGSLIPICSLSNSSLLPSLIVLCKAVMRQSSVLCKAVVEPRFKRGDIM